MMDLAGAGGASASTRGATGRAKLQAELASHSGSFDLAVLRAMSRRMQPTASSSGTPLELLQRKNLRDFVHGEVRGFWSSPRLGSYPVPADGQFGLPPSRQPGCCKGRYSFA